jgi:hypothetical protein
MGKIENAVAPCLGCGWKKAGWMMVGESDREHLCTTCWGWLQYYLCGRIDLADQWLEVRKERMSG